MSCPSPPTMRRSLCHHGQKAGAERGHICFKKTKDEKAGGLEAEKSLSVKLVSLSRSLQLLCFLQKRKSPLMRSRVRVVSQVGEGLQEPQEHPR